jgi:hypothetical protein
MRCVILGTICVVVTAAILLGAGGAALDAGPPRSSQAAACHSPEARQFDFWIGSWDVSDFGREAKIAHVRVEPLLEGCALQEVYQDAEGLEGRSLSMYDPSTGHWYQSWMTNRGHRLDLKGGIRGHEMVLEGIDRAKGATLLVRGRWKTVDGGVRETAATSSDGGKTWKPWFDLMFRRAPSKNDEAAVAEDRRVVSALDDEYQEAVKRNDAAIMDRILADEFRLVTGSGKTYDKADLLEEARSGRFTYEHQEDIEKEVRIFGDTAIVTAKLWEKGTVEDRPFDKTLWFSDTYVRTPSGWRYVFGQSSLPLPKDNSR